MSKRKPNNGFARAERSCRELLRTNYVAVVNMDSSGSNVRMRVVQEDPDDEIICP
ncbi:hypothetical protein SAMN05216558_1837 [Pseudomonas vancouverensis]|nr:hypothetical protein SAMN05216558_1837 [Pseudomonas vancouverensis]